MLPAVIDLTSSPEPEDSLETAAKSSLSSFHPRKQKQKLEARRNKQPTQGNGQSPIGAAVAVLEDFFPRKQKANPNGLAEDEVAHVRTLVLPTEGDARVALSKIREESRRIGPNGVQKGSLASLLQQQTKLSRAGVRTPRNGNRVVSTPERLSEHEQKSDTENERIQVLSAFQSQQPKAKARPAIIPRENKTPDHTPTKSNVSASAGPLGSTVALNTEKGAQSSTNADWPKPNGSLSREDTEELRLFKRRRIGVSDDSDTHSLHRKRSESLQDSQLSPATQFPASQIPIRSASPVVSNAPKAFPASNAPRTASVAPSSTSFQSNSRDGVNDIRPFKEWPSDIPPRRNVPPALASNSIQKETESIEPRQSTINRVHIRPSSPAVDTPTGTTQTPNELHSTPHAAKSVLKVSESLNANQSRPNGLPVSAPHGVDMHSKFINTHRKAVSPEVGVNPPTVEVPDTQDSGSTPEDGSSRRLLPPQHVFRQAARRLENKSDHTQSPKQAQQLPRVISHEATSSSISLNVELPDDSKSHGGHFTADEDALLIKLKEVDGLGWDDIVRHFKGSRTYGSLQVRYSTKLKSRIKDPKVVKSKHQIRRPALKSAREDVTRSTSPDVDAYVRRPRKRRNNEASVMAGYISWADVKKQRLIEETQSEVLPEESTKVQAEHTPKFNGERAYPKSLIKILRQREIGSNVGRSWAPTTKSVPDELKERIFDDLGPRKYFKGTSGDVTCLAWASNGRNFAAGSIAITDERSMQYNRPCNLVLGRHDRDVLQELPEHHIARPDVKASDGNANGLHSMRETQDPRLFMTVASVQFSPDGEILYSAGSDQKVRAYQMGRDDVSCLYEIEHAAPLDLLSVSNSNVLATACHQSADNSIGIYRNARCLLSLSPSRVDEQTKRAIYPSALRWGAAARHSNLLLAGFSIDSVDEERNIAGETCLWDVASETRIHISGVTRNVFDVAWNPTPSLTSTTFAVASSRGTGKTSKDTRSVIQCFAPGQNRARRVVEWECPAFDINDAIYCQHDDNLIAVGATDGRVYVWDQRFANRSNAPLHILQHGDTLNVLDHDREREIADTGVRFLSWGATSSRLFSGSSDGVVKIWNPYRSTEDAHLKDLATFDSAIMSGAFSPDYRDLLIGEDQGRINSLSVGYDHKAVRSMQRFELRSAPAPIVQDNRFVAARELRETGQIAIVPMGDLPSRQAVQGPKYRGPYLEPSTNELLRAQNEYQFARDAQNEADHQDTMSSTQGDGKAQRMQHANKRVQEAQFELMRMQNRSEDSATLGPLARANQRAFLRAAEARLQLEVSQPIEYCKLDCNYLPSSVDDAGEVPDSRRSEMRIPGMLRAPKPLCSADITKEEILESEMTAKCISCLGAARKAPPGKQTLCEQCHRTRLGLNASCELCSGPMRLSAGSSVPKLCERCNFACFRCGKPTFTDKSISAISCDRCQLVWQAGVLGYELLMGVASIAKPSEGSNEHNMESPAEQPLCDGEIEHYASRWGMK